MLSSVWALAWRPINLPQSNSTSLLLHDPTHFSFQLELDPCQQNSHANQVNFVDRSIGNRILLWLMVAVVVVRLKHRALNNIWANPLPPPLHPEPMRKFAFYQYIYVIFNSDFTLPPPVPPEHAWHLSSPFISNSRCFTPQEPFLQRNTDNYNMKALCHSEEGRAHAYRQTDRERQAAEGREDGL